MTRAASCSRSEMLQSTWWSIILTLFLVGVHLGSCDDRSQHDDSCPNFIPEPLDPVLQRIMDVGGDISGDSGVAAGERPPWLDMKKFRLGQAFARKYLFGVLISEFHALYLLYTFPNLLDPMVFTGRSDTPDEAYERYLDTVDRVVSWYFSDVFDDMSPAFQNLMIVRALHTDVRTKMNRLSASELQNRTQVPGYIACPHQAKMRQNFASFCPYGYQSDTTNYDREWISQRDMAITQWGFLGLIVSFPKAYGISSSVKSEEMDAFVHVWEVLGFLLGVKDEFNICQGGFEAVRKRSYQLIKYFVLPSLQVITPKWEHMTKCMAEGIGYFVLGADFETGMTIVLKDVLHVNASAITSALTPAQRAAVAQYRGTLNVLNTVPDAWRPTSVIGYAAFQAIKRIPRDTVKRTFHKRNAQREDCYVNNKVP